MVPQRDHYYIGAKQFRKPAAGRSQILLQKKNYKLICFIQIYVVSLYSNNNTMNTLHFRDFCEMVVRGNKRTDQVQQGAYDGRFKPRVIEDKKKKQSKLLCRIKIKTY